MIEFIVNGIIIVAGLVLLFIIGVNVWERWKK